MSDIFYISISFSAGKEKAAMISALLMSIGFEGAEETDTETIVSIPEELFDENEINEIFSGFEVPYQVKKIKQQNWNAKWESSFEPVQVGNFVRVRASFHEADLLVQHDIIVTPKMSFGTGHHATTYLMLQEMQHIDFAGKTVIDFGTGTGVLAILAEKMGAINITAIDNDEWSIANAEENFVANGCFKIELMQANELVDNGQADVVLANINLNVILNNLNALKKSLNTGGQILFSGLLVSDKDDICNALVAHEFSILKITERDNWLMIATGL